MEELKAPNYSTCLLDQLRLLQQNNMHCDARLTAEGGGVSAHKVVLMAASPYLNSCLSTKVQTEVGSKGSIHIQNTPLRLVEKVVDFIYTGNLVILNEDFDMIFKLCKDLDITSAVGLCENYINKDKASTGICEYPLDGSKQPDIKVSYEPVAKDKIWLVKDASLIESYEITHIDSNSIDNSVEGKLDSTALKKDCVISDMTEKRKRKSRPPYDNGPHREIIPQKITRSRAKDKRSVKIKSTTSRSKKIPLTKPAKSQKKSEEILQHGEDYPLPHLVESDSLDIEINVNKGDSIKNKGEIETCINKSIEDIKTVKSEKSKSPLDKRKKGSAEKKVKEIRQESKIKIKVRRFKQFPCSICSKILTSQKRLAFHEFSKHGAPFDEKRYTMYPCSREGCDYVSGSRSNLQTHLKSRHGDDRPHVCEFCGKAFKLPNILAIHLNIHTGSKMWKCETCGEHFNQQSGLSIHIKRHHMGESSWGELCHLCSEKFLQKSDLAWHLFRAHDQPLPDKYKAYICDICNYLTKSSQDLQRHQNAHKGIKQFSCSLCKKTCSTKSQLKRHERFHGEKSFKCTFDNCTYACVDSIGLSKHIKLMHTHKNFKPYVCPVCSYKTGVKGNLDKHIRQVHFLEVVTKHTVQLKMKYANFESGDIITKDGRLVASAKERKEMHQHCLEENRMAVTSQEEMVSSINSIIPSHTEDSMVYTHSVEEDHKTIQPLKPVSYELRQELPSGSVINLTSMAPSLVHLSETVVSTNTVPTNNVLYVQGSY